MTGPRTRTKGPTRVLVNRRPADGLDKNGDMVGGAIWRGNHRKSGSGDMVEVPSQLLVTRRPADGPDKDEDKGTKDKEKGPTWWLVTRQPADGPDKNKDWGTMLRARELGQGPGTAGTEQNRKGQPRLGYSSEIRILEHGRGCHLCGNHRKSGSWDMVEGAILRGNHRELEKGRSREK